MATKKTKNPVTTYYFPGWVMWAKVFSPDPEFNNFTIDFFPEDLDALRKILKDEGSKLTEKEANTEGSPGPIFIKFRREESRVLGERLIKFGPPLVVQADGVTPETRYLGNGTKVLAKVEFFDTRNGRGHRLLALRVDELIEYSPDTPKEVTHLPF